MADRTFKYVDKDRILPWLEQQIREYAGMGDVDENLLTAANHYAMARAYRDVLVHVKSGLFDWQPSQ